MADPFQPRFVDLVRNLTSTQGTGNIVLGAAVSGFTSFTDAIAAGESFYYSVIGVDKPAEREIGRGTMLANGRISREAIGGTLTNFTSGQKSIALIAAAEWFETIQAGLGGGAELPAGNFGVATRAELALLSSPTGTTVLTEPGREGVFVWSAGDLSATVARDPAQGIYVAPASAPTGASGAWVRKFDGPHNVKWWGAKGDASYTGTSGTDDSASINAALAFLDNRVAGQNRGGTLFFPAGHYKCAGPLDLEEMVYITLCGQAGMAVGYTAPAPSQLVFTGTGERFLNARSSASLSLRDLGIRYTNAAFTGKLVDLSKHPSHGDTAYALVERCLIGGQDVTSASRVIDLNGAILCSVVDCHIGWGKVGIGGRHASEGPGYSNAHHFSRITFDNLTVTALLNAVEGWTVDTCWFEGTNGGSGGMPRAYWDDLPAGSITSGLTWVGNWHGDAVNVADAWFSSNNTALWGLTISGGLFGTYVPNQCIKLKTQCTGIVIQGCSMQYGPDLGGFNHQGVTIKGNSFYSGDVTNVAAGAQNVDISGNYLNGGTAKTWIRANLVQEASFAGTLTGTTVAATSVLSVGNAAIAGTNTPAKLDLGGTYSLTAGQNPKLSIFNDGGENVYGIGISASQLDYLCPAGTAHSFYVGGSRRVQITDAGISATGTITAANLSGSNTGDQVITLTGDVTGSGSGSFAATIGANKVTFAKFVAASGAGLVGASAAGNFGELSPAAARSVLALADIASSGNGADLAASSVSYAKLQNVTGPSLLLGRASAGAGIVEEISLANGLAMSGTALGLGATTPASVVTPGALTSSGTAGNGYSAGAGGTVTQATNKSTGVTLNKICGRVTMASASLAASTSVSFTMTNSTIAATDVVLVNIASGGTANAYSVTVDAVAAGSCRIHVRNMSGGALAEALVLNFAVTKAVTA